MSRHEMGLFCRYCGRPSEMVPCDNRRCKVGVHPWCDCNTNDEIDGHWCDMEER